MKPFFIQLLNNINSTVVPVPVIEEVINWELLYQSEDLGQGTLSLSGGTGEGWVAGAYSKKTLDGNGSIFFKVNDSFNNGAGIGLSKQPTGFNLNGEIAIVITSNGSTQAYTIFESGVQKATGSTDKDIVYEIKVVDKIAKIYAGTTLLYSSSVILSMPTTPIGILHNGRSESKITEAKIVSSSISGKLEAANYPTDSFYYFRPYLSADHPLVLNDRKYFFLFSTDHHNSTGGLYWGKGNNLDLTDFEYGGLIKSGDQIETPILVNLPASQNSLGVPAIGILHQTDSSEVGNDNKQQTRLMVSAGGAELHNMSFFDEGRPLGIIGDENHTGYAMPYWTGTEWIVTHIAKSGLPQPWKVSKGTDIRSLTRAYTIDVHSGIDPDYFFQPSSGQYFDYNGEQWWIGAIHPDVDSGIFDADKKIIVAKSNTRFGAVTQQAILFGGEENLRHSVRIFNGIAHIYFTNPKGRVYYRTYNLTNLQQYL